MAEEAETLSATPQPQDAAAEQPRAQGGITLPALVVSFALLLMLAVALPRWSLAKNYPLGIADLQPLIREAMATDPDAFVAMSYPPDTFMLTEQCQVVGFNPKFMYVAIGGVFPTYKGKFGDKVNGILAYGGVDWNGPGVADYRKAHREVLNRDSEAGAVNVYAGLEVVQQAIEAVGEIDRKKIRDTIASGKFQTVWGELSYSSQRNASPWCVGQWQNGDIVGVYPSNKAGAKPLLFPKPAWS